MVIDFHTHTFPGELAGRAIGRLAASSRARNYLDGTAGALRASMREAGVDYSVLLPVVSFIPSSSSFVLSCPSLEI